MKSATAAAEPLDEPPGVWPRFSGLRVVLGVCVANSLVATLPSTTAPCSRATATLPASSRGRWPAKMGEPYAVG